MNEQTFEKGLPGKLKFTLVATKFLFGVTLCQVISQSSSEN
jgi:hypothetical protein